MANNKNLIPFNKRTESEQREIARKGGIKSGESRGAKKTFKEFAEILLNMEADEYSKDIIKKLFPTMNENDMTSKMAMLCIQYEKAVKKGDSKAFEVLRDTAGEKPVNYIESTNLNTDLDMSELTIEQLQKIADMTPEQIENLANGVK